MSDSREQKIGVLYAVSAFGFWGLVPIYFKAVAHVTPLEILCHRVVWSVPLTALLITLGGDWPALRTALGNRKVPATLLLTATLVAGNWFIFIYAVNTDRVLQASLGYFINPLVNVLLGVIFLRERLKPFQVTAVILAAAGTLNLTFRAGQFPWIALALAFSFGLYGLLRKTVQIESVNGLFVETSLVCPPAITCLLYLGARGKMAFGTVDATTTILLFLAGAVTTFPLVWFTSGARRLRYATVGLLQYMAPSLHFVLAVFLYREPFGGQQLVSFGFIWTGLLIYAVDSHAAHRR